MCDDILNFYFSIQWIKPGASTLPYIVIFYILPFIELFLCPLFVFVFGFFCSVLFLIFETGSPYVAQSALELSILLLLPSSAGITSVHHHARPGSCIFVMSNCKIELCFLEQRNVTSSREA
jgi:hypothetical protein